MTSSAVPDLELERGLDQLLSRLAVRHEKLRLEEYGIKYTISTRPGIDLQLDLELYADQLNVNFNRCFLMLEAAAHMPKFRRNPNALSEWRAHSLNFVRDLLTSDLRVETWWTRGRLKGGFLDRWDDNHWERCGGGGPFLPVRDRKLSEYRSWRA